MRCSLWLLGIITAVLIASLCFGAIPSLINYQGRLTEAGQNIADGQYLLTLSLYADSTAGSAMWSEVQSVSVAGGLFHVLLGAQNPVAASVFDQPNVWLGIRLAANPEMTPRQRIVSSAFAYHALEADTAAYARTASGGWTDEGNVVHLTENTDFVGIGTASPSVQLHVGSSASGTQRAQIEGSTVIRTNSAGRARVLTLANLNGLPGSGTSLYFQGLNGSSMFTTAGRIDGYLTDQTPLAEKGALVFMPGPNLSEAMRIDDQGNVGIGTDAPTARLSVEGGDVRFDGNLPGAECRWNSTRSALQVGLDSDGTHWLPESTGVLANVIGVDAKAPGMHAIAIGEECTARGYNGVAIGKWVSTGTYDNSMVIGSGDSETAPLVNNIAGSLMIGFASETPTLFIGGPSNRVGIGTSAPAERLEVVGNTRIAGALETDSNDVRFMASTSGGKLLWLNSNMALRAGRVTGTQWDASQVGDYSTATGYNTQASGDYSIGLGRESAASGLAAVALGDNADATGAHSIAIGSEALAAAANAITMGRFLQATADNAITIGCGAAAPSPLVNNRSNSVMIGFSATPTIYADASRVGIGDATPDVQLEVGEMVRIQGTNYGSWPSSGEGLELAYNPVNNTAIVQSYSRTSSTFGHLALMGDSVGVGTTAPLEKLHVNGKVYVATMDATTGGSAVYWYNNRLCRYTSSAKYKDDIRPLETDFAEILRAQPRSFVDRVSGQHSIGFIAEEFDALGLRDLVVYRDGEPDGLRYELVSLYLLEIVKTQAEKILQLEEKSRELEKKVESLP